MNRKENIRTIKSKKKIKDNFINMILNDEDITVISLSQKCGLNRNTFYIHYHSIDDVMEELRVQIVSEITSKLDKKDLDSLSKNPEILGHIVVEVLYADTLISNLVLKSKYRQEFCILITSKLVEYMAARFEKYDPLNVYARSSLAFLVGGTIFALYDAYESNSTLTPDQIIERLGQISRVGVESFRK